MPELLSTKNQTSNSPEFTKAWNKQTDLLKSLYYNKALNANVTDFSNQKELGWTRHDIMKPSQDADLL